MSNIWNESQYCACSYYHVQTARPLPCAPYHSPSSSSTPAPIGLIISEATQVSNDGQGYPLTPGVYTPEQIAGWKKITDAVHAKVRPHTLNKSTPVGFFGFYNRPPPAVKFIINIGNDAVNHCL